MDSSRSCRVPCSEILIRKVIETNKMEFKVSVSKFGLFGSGVLLPWFFFHGSGMLAHIQRCVET